MKHRVLILTPNVMLGIIAMSLGGITLLSGDSPHEAPPRVNPRELARQIEQELDHVTPGELADMIAEGTLRTLIIDLRSPAEFERMHVPGAVNMSLTSLLDARLPKEGLIVLYSGGGIHAEQALLLLWFEGIRNVRTILGGFTGWESEVLHANRASDAGPRGHRNTDHGGANGPNAAGSLPRGDSTQTRGVQKEREKMRGEC